MAENAIVKIMTALLKHQVKKVVGDEALGEIGKELVSIGGDKVDEQIKSWLGEETNAEELENAALYAHTCFQDKVEDHELVQWMVSLPLGDLPKVVEAIEKLPISPDEKELENALRESVSKNWKKLSLEQVENTVDSFLSCLRSAILPIQRQTLMVIGRSVLRTEDKVDLLLRWFEQYIIKGVPTPVDELDEGLSDYWNLKHPYPMPPNFTGRLGERKMLIDWLENDGQHPLFILSALGGFGKSALTWHWLTYDVREKDWPKVLWWSFYEGDSSFENFIKESLEYLGIEVPPGQRTQVDELLKALSSQKVLLIIDGFERALRAYSSMSAAYQEDEENEEQVSQRDCVNLNAEIFLKNLCVLPNIKGKILMTTRLTPRAVEQRGELLDGCHEEELQAIQKEDAVAFFRAQGIRGARAEIESACQPYGYHPLSLRILAGLIADDRETSGDIAVAGKLDITDDVIQNKHHVLEVAYNTLSPEQQKLLSHIACFRSAMTYDALKAIAEGRGLDADLKTLEYRGLLHWDKTTNKYDLHPIVRRYAYERLTAPDQTSAHERLVDYFEAVPKPSKVEKLEDLSSVVELYYHMVGAGKYDNAMDVLRNRLHNALYYQLGNYQLLIEMISSLFPEGENKLPYLKRDYAQAWALSGLANSYSTSGQPHHAVSLFEMANKIYENNIEYKQYLATGLGNIAQTQITIGDLSIAEANLLRAINLCQEIKNELWESNGHGLLGRLQALQGMWQEAEKEFSLATSGFQRQNQAHAEAFTNNDRAICYLFMYREQRLPIMTENIRRTVERTKNLLTNWTKDHYPMLVENLKSDWILGVIFRLENQLDLSEYHLDRALTLCRSINYLDHEANILLDMARLRYAQEKPKETKTLVEEALLITERSGYVLQGADVHLFLAQYALEQEKDKEKAKELAERAKELATCDGPPYYYKVAYDEAEKFLEDLNRE